MTIAAIEPAAATLADPRWAAVLARDPAADGHFVYSVRTTGVYCRPSCAARTARPENIAFHATPAEAERAGFRPCRRCRPDAPPRAERDAARVAEICRRLDACDPLPPLADIAREAGWSLSWLHRCFKATTGLTPRAYLAARRAERMREALARGEQVTGAIYAAGYGSNGRFYEQSSAVLGMRPTTYRNGGADQAIRFAVGQCSLGAILVAASEKGVCAVSLGDDPEALVQALQDRFPRAELIGGDAGFETIVAQVIGLIEAPATGLALPLDLRGTVFQQRVWQALREIPPGEKVSYSELARRVGMPAAVRAVASACAANPVAVAIPCHRVVRTDGSLSGYRWGVARKLALLAREAGE